MEKVRRQWIVSRGTLEWIKEDAKRARLQDRLGRYLEVLVEEVQTLRARVKELEEKADK